MVDEINYPMNIYIYISIWLTWINTKNYRYDMVLYFTYRYYRGCYRYTWCTKYNGNIMDYAVYVSHNVPMTKGPLLSGFALGFLRSATLRYCCGSRNHAGAEAQQWCAGGKSHRSHRSLRVWWAPEHLFLAQLFVVYGKLFIASWIVYDCII